MTHFVTLFERGRVKESVGYISSLSAMNMADDENYCVYHLSFKFCDLVIVQHTYWTCSSQLWLVCCRDEHKRRGCGHREGCRVMRNNRTETFNLTTSLCLVKNTCISAATVSTVLCTFENGGSFKSTRHILFLTSMLCFLWINSLCVLVYWMQKTDLQVIIDHFQEYMHMWIFRHEPLRQGCVHHPTCTLAHTRTSTHTHAQTHTPHNSK